MCKKRNAQESISAFLSVFAFTIPEIQFAEITSLLCRPDPRGGLFYSSSSFSTAMNASVGSWTVPRVRIFFLPSFCFSSSFFFRVMSPP